MIKQLFAIFILSLSTLAAKPYVVTSFSILGDVVKNIAGEYCDVESIVGPNGDTHVFQPTPATSQMILKSNLVIMNGLGFEPWLNRLLEAMQYKGVVIKASKGPTKALTPLIAFKNLDHKVQVADPHVWNDIENVKIWVLNIRDTLIKLDPEHANDFKDNADKYLKELDTLNAWIKDQYKKFPKKKCKIITAHDAFNYYEHAYGIQMLAPVGLATQDEPSAFELAALVDLIRKEKISTLFVENINNRKIIQQLANETGAKLGKILYSDALSEKGAPADTYVNYMKYNTLTIAESLCDACRP